MLLCEIRLLSDPNFKATPFFPLYLIVLLWMIELSKDDRYNPLMLLFKNLDFVIRIALLDEKYNPSSLLFVKLLLKIVPFVSE
ncbi:hypothetical protein ES703_49539 [subsurface metagenome]